jgi:hypothetical protein
VFIPGGLLTASVGTDAIVSPVIIDAAIISIASAIVLVMYRMHLDA